METTRLGQLLLDVVQLLGDTANTDLKFMAFDRWEDATTEFCSFQPFIHNDGWIGGGIVNLNGVGFGLTVFNPSRENEASFNIPGNPLRGSLSGQASWRGNSKVCRSESTSRGTIGGNTRRSPTR